MTHKLYGFLFFLLILVCPVLGLSQKSDLYSVPTAILPEPGMLESGVLIERGLKNEEPFTHERFLMRYTISHFTEYSLSLSESQAFHSLQLVLWKDSIGAVSHYFGTGIKNVGWESLKNQSVNPSLSYYLNYSAETNGLGVHAGLGKNRQFAPDLLLFGGLDFVIPIGRLFAEWDGQFVNLGAMFRFQDTMAFYLGMTPKYTEEPGKETSMLRFGVSVYDQVLSSVKRAEQREVAPLPDLSEDDETIVDSGSDSDFSAVIKSLQIGLKAYRDGDYEKAAIILEEVVKDYPAVSTLSSLGSIYYKLNRKEEAKAVWKKALDKDPRNVQLRQILMRLDGERN